MRFGVIYPAYGEHADPSLAAWMAREAERRGAEVFLVWDHFLLPFEGGERTLEAYTLLSYLAGKTERIRLGTCVTPLPLRDPLLLAKVISSLDVLSGGRVVVGVGAGWNAPEVEAYGRWEGAGVRVERTGEALELMVRMWRGEEVSFQGKFYSARGTLLRPLPLQRPHPPLWFGTTGRRMLELTLRYGDGWIPAALSPRQYGKLAGFLRERLPGERRESFVFSLQDWVSAEEVADRAREFEREGCRLYCAVLPAKREEALELLRRMEELG
jgi:alkanesulfonate monooxygenase SsuD/methylene tetrahydromethanopterin reductase-like flavin-dependent oxidoreductase (luciferase family)